MKTKTLPPPGAGARASIERYYRLHSQIYDATRWSFLFGRTAVLREVAAVTTPERILEVGCGTGKNLVNLCRIFPQAAVTGMDLSETMLSVARRKTAPLGARVQLLHEAYGASFDRFAAYDLILFSYALSMFNPGFEDAVVAASQNLVEGGHLAVVDFHNTPFRFFERWMGVNHVRMNGQLRPLLADRFQAHTNRLCAAYGGGWRYLIFIGQKVTPSIT